MQVRQAGGGRGYVIPSILIPDGSTYYPPVPNSSWSNTEFEVNKAKRVMFPNASVASKYTIIQFLQTRFGRGFHTYLTGLLREDVFEFRPRIPSDRPLFDLLRLVVFYDNNDRVNGATSGGPCAVPMAVCMLLPEGQGVFALVDDFGSVIKATTHRFLVSQRMTRRWIGI